MSDLTKCFNLTPPVIQKGINVLSLVGMPGEWTIPQYVSPQWSSSTPTSIYGALQFTWQQYTTATSAWTNMTSGNYTTGTTTSSNSACNTYTLNSSDINSFYRLGLRSVYNSVTSDFVYSNEIFIDRYITQITRPKEQLKEMLVVWLDSSDNSTVYSASATNTTAVNGTLVEVWKDKSGNNNHMVQLSAANRPVYRTGTNGFNNKSVVRCDQVNGTPSVREVFMTTPSISSTSCKTVVILYIPRETVTSTKYAGRTIIIQGDRTTHYRLGVTYYSTLNPTGNNLQIYAAMPNRVWGYGYLSNTLDSNTNSTVGYTGFLYPNSVFTQTLTAQDYTSLQPSYYNSFHTRSAYDHTPGTPFVMTHTNQCITYWHNYEAGGYSTFYMNGSKMSQIWGGSFPLKSQPIRIFSCTAEYTYPSSSDYVNGNFVGDIAEILILNKALEPSDVKMIYDYLNLKWGF